MQWGAIVGTLAAVIGLASVAWRLFRRGQKAGGSWLGRWVGKHVAEHLKPVVSQQLKPVVEQMTPNGGASAVDRIARLDQWRIDTTHRLNDIQKHLDRQDEEMYDHLRDHANRPPR